MGVPYFYCDSQEWYQNTTIALDVISIAGAAAAGAATLKATKLLMANSGKSTLSILKGLSRAERKRLTQDIIRLNHPSVSNRVLKSMVKNGRYPKRFSGLKITQSLQLQLKDAVGASMSFAGSALSGNVNSLAVGIYEELDR
jgi:cell division inhibitor SulA